MATKIARKFIARSAKTGREVEVGVFIKLAAPKEFMDGLDDNDQLILTGLDSLPWPVFTVEDVFDDENPNYEVELGDMCYLYGNNWVAT